MKAFYDLHIHSCLSPCSCDDMTPVNIAAMAQLKGLSLIALTDHNCAKNLPSMAAAAKAFGLVFVPGIEVTSRDEVHVLTYFDEVDTALGFGKQMYQSLPPLSNRPDIFGRQIMMDMHDHIAGEAKKLLLSATSYTIDDIVKMVRQQGGCAVPAHINRDSFSVFSNLGFLPQGLFHCVEVSKAYPCPPLDPGLCILHSSDAHRLEDIAEQSVHLSGIHSASDFICFVNDYNGL